MVFKIRALSDEQDDFVREYEVPADVDLLQLHDFLCNELGYDASGFSSFFAADEAWRKHREYTLMDMADDSFGVDAQPMEGNTLKALIADGHSRLVFVFDQLSGRALYLEIAGLKKAEDDTVYPRTTLAEGNPPAQTDMLLDEEDDPFGDMMEEFADFEGTEDNGFDYDD